ncbi:hypothetical protein Tco_0322733 [Tanacetum coccineum]
MADALIRQKHFWRIQLLGDKLRKLMSMKQNCNCNVFSKAEYRGVYPQVDAQVKWMWTKQGFKIMASLQQNTVVSATLKLNTKLADMFTKALLRIGLSILSEGLVESIPMIQPEPEDLPKDESKVRNSIVSQNHMLIELLLKTTHGPSDAMHNPSPAIQVLSTETFSFVMEIHTLSIDKSPSEIVEIIDRWGGNLLKSLRVH